jgi:hypothetical protein
MKHKMILLALAAVSAVMFALPAVASAGEWEITKPENFTAKAGVTTLTQDPISAGESVSEVTCTASNTTGKYTTKTTAEEVTITFTGCTAPSPFGGTVNCTSAGQAAGTIKTTDLTAHNIMIDPTPNAIAGVLITPAAGHFATFNCGGIFEVKVNGNGVIGEVEKKCGESITTSGLNFESSATGTQKYMQITTTGTKFDLSSTTTIFGGGATTRTSSQDGTGTITFPNAQTMTCP